MKAIRPIRQKKTEREKWIESLRGNKHTGGRVRPKTKLAEKVGKVMVAERHKSLKKKRTLRNVRRPKEQPVFKPEFVQQ